MNRYFLYNKNKYHNQKIVYDDQKFDSVLELAYYKYLKDQVKEGSVVKFTRQPSFTLINTFKYKGTTYRKRRYTADFMVEYKDGRKEVIEIKGFADTSYKLRKALFLSLYVVNTTHPEFDFVELHSKDIRAINDGLKINGLKDAVKQKESELRRKKRSSKKKEGKK